MKERELTKQKREGEKYLRGIERKKAIEIERVREIEEPRNIEIGRDIRVEKEIRESLRAVERGVRERELSRETLKKVKSN